MSILRILPGTSDIIDGMDGLDFPGDICPECRHALREGICPTCDSEALVTETEAWLRGQGDVGGRP